MYRLRSLSRGGRVLLAIAAGGALFGIASAVQADIPDSGVIHGCYGKAGTPYKGELRVRDASQGEQCRVYENPLDWNQTGETGATGPSGPTGPAGVSLFAVVNSDGTLVHGTATGAVKNVSGDYTVTFGQDVSGCAANATPGEFPGSTIGTESSPFIFVGSPSSDKVTVELQSSIGNISSPFFLIVAC
jgi:hypothetical protein